MMRILYITIILIAILLNSCGNNKYLKTMTEDEREMFTAAKERVEKQFSSVWTDFAGILPDTITKYIGIKHHKIFVFRTFQMYPHFPILIAVGDDKRAFYLTPYGEFNNFIRREDILIKTPEEALDFIKLWDYLIRGFSYNYHKIIEGMDDLINYAKQWCISNEDFNRLFNQFEKYENIISAPSVEVRKGIYIINYFVCSRPDIEQKIVHLSERGEILMVKRRRVGMLTPEKLWGPDELSLKWTVVYEEDH